MPINPLSIVEIGGRLLDKVIPDKDAREKAQAELIKAAQDQDFQKAMGQIEINKEDARSGDNFRGGWRPFIGWTCGGAFALHFVVFPVMNFFVVGSGGEEIKIAFDMDTLLTVLGGLLGLGAFRSYEKTKGLP
jgi:hypothetical protein